MSENFNTLVVGVGGQGVMTLTGIIVDAASRKGLKARVYETLGMAQRGGHVETHIRLGKNIISPQIPKGQTDILIALEPNEALQVAESIGEEASIILNTNQVPPIPVMMGEATYLPLERIISLLKNLGKNVYAFDAYELARKAGTVRVLNTVLLGAFSALNLAPLTRDELLESMKDEVPEKYLKANMRAFKAGESEIRKSPE